MLRPAEVRRLVQFIKTYESQDKEPQDIYEEWERTLDRVLSRQEVQEAFFLLDQVEHIEEGIYEWIVQNY